jgi:hypothetical protein
MRTYYACGVAVTFVMILVCRGHASTAIDMALWEAVREGNEKWVTETLAQGADVNARNNSGSTALILAAMNGNTKILKMLLDKGADVRATGQDGHTALRWATEKGHGEIVKILEARLAEIAEKECAIRLDDIPPLYTEPKLPGEGVWNSKDMPEGENGKPVMYQTVYRPSTAFPNATVHMLLFNMKCVSMKLYLGTGEPGGSKSTSMVEQSAEPFLLAITNALWQSRHAGRGGIIYRGKVLKKMAKGVAAIVLLKNGTVDIVEWNDQIPVSEIQDARQLKHLILKDGKIVTSIMKRGKTVHSEIGLGSLLNEDRPVLLAPSLEPEKKKWALNLTSGPLWFIATRSAFGIREDGNLVYALGQHIGTKDLAKALALAGCVRAIHGDANPGNCVGIIYFHDESGKIVKRARLYPDQDRSTLYRYVNRSYPKDFFAYFRSHAQRELLQTPEGSLESASVDSPERTETRSAERDTGKAPR